MLITQMEMEDVLRVYIILIKTGMPRYATSFYTFLCILANVSLLQGFVHILSSVCLDVFLHCIDLDVLCL